MITYWLEMKGADIQKLWTLVEKFILFTFINKIYY